MKKWCFEIIIFVCLLIGIMLFKYKISDNNLVGVYVDNIESSLLPDKDNYVIDKVVCDNEAVGTWDNANWNLLITNLSKKSNCKLYFRSKKEITVTYDNNFVKNNIFENIYTTNYINHFPSNEVKINFSSYYENGAKIYKMEAQQYESDSWVGCYFGYSRKLEKDKVYYYSFEVMGNEEFYAIINSEQDSYTTYSVTNNWKKYSKKFTARDDFGSFVFYNWISATGNRTLELKNLSLQEGEYDNFLSVNLKEYDTLNNTIPTPTRDNYTFLGWYTDPIEGEKISAGTQVTEDTTYYAHWQYNE